MTKDDRKTSEANNKVAPKEQIKVKTAAIAVEIPEGHASSSPVTASDKKGLKKSASISSTNKSEDALTNPALYHAAGTSYFRLFHLGKNHQLRQNNDKFKIGYGHVCEFMAPDAVSTTIRVGNALIDACSELSSKYTFLMSTAPENRQLAVAHNPVTAACDRSDVRELKHIFSAVAQIDALSGAFLAAFDRVLAAGYVKKIGDAAEALAVLKATVATLQLRDKERRAPVASKAATTLEALQAHAQTKSSPAVLEAINDLQVFVATLKSDAPASWTFVKSLAAVVTKEEVAPTSKVRSAVVDLLSTVNDAFGNALFATSETVAMAVHASAKSVPKNCVKYFVRHQLNLGGAVQGVWALVRDIGPSALLAYMVLKNEQLLPW